MEEQGTENEEDSNESAVVPEYSSNMSYFSYCKFQGWLLHNCIYFS